MPNWDDDRHAKYLRWLLETPDRTVTVAQLREILAPLPDDMITLGFAEGFFDYLSVTRRKVAEFDLLVFGCG